MAQILSRGLTMKGLRELGKLPVCKEQLTTDSTSSTTKVKKKTKKKPFKMRWD